MHEPQGASIARNRKLPTNKGVNQQRFSAKTTKVSAWERLKEYPGFTQIYISGWIFQKVLAEIVQKGVILSEKALISNRRNFGLFAPKPMRFPSKDSKSKDLSF